MSKTEVADLDQDRGALAVDAQPDASPDVAENTEADRFERRWSKRTGTKAARTEALSAEPAGDPAADLEKEKERAGDLHDRLQRAMADLSNYRKRVEAEREEMAKLASMLLVAEILPVLDNFERALATVPKELEMLSWIQGVALIERHLRAILERQGVEAIDAVGSKFNPNLHEAIVEEESSDAEPGTVVGELQTGYKMHGHVLRPTLAKIAKAPAVQPDASQRDEGPAAGSEEPS